MNDDNRTVERFTVTIEVSLFAFDVEDATVFGNLMRNELDTGGQTIAKVTKIVREADLTHDRCLELGICFCKKS